MALPFDLPSLSRGFAELSSGVREVGGAMNRGAACSVAGLLGCEVTISARPVPGLPAPRAAVARVGIELVALPGAAVLEVEPALLAAIVDRLAGAPASGAHAATSLTPVEAAALDLLALVALDGVCGVPAVEERLAPRLARTVAEPAATLAVELQICAANATGRGRLLVPASAVRALRDAQPAEPGAALRLSVSVRAAGAALGPDALDALAPGDVIVIDGVAEPTALVLPGGYRAAGRLEDGLFHVQETHMTERQAQIPVTLEVELARVEVTLADLARLEPGAAFPLGIDRRGLVTLRSGERAVARGELVDVDGAVGVRILSVEVTP
jgi:type III secretion protein Q